MADTVVGIPTSSFVWKQGDFDLHEYLALVSPRLPISSECLFTRVEFELQTSLRTQA